MKHTKQIMGMDVTVEIKDFPSPNNTDSPFDLVFNYFHYIDEKFSTYKEDSEISKINRREISPDKFSEDMEEIFRLSEITKKETQGYFEIKKQDNSIDPSGMVKGWAIWQASKLLDKQGYKNYFIDIGGDIQTHIPENSDNEFWKIGIRNPFNLEQIVKILKIKNEGVATSGNYERGHHIYNPLLQTYEQTDILSITVIGENIYEADRFATAAFAMGKSGITFLESINGLEGYMIDINGIATETSNFHKFVIN